MSKGKQVSNNSKYAAQHDAIAAQIEEAKAAPEAIALADAAASSKMLEQLVAEGVEKALAEKKAARKAASGAEKGGDYSMYSAGAAALIRACGQRPQNDRAKLTALVFDNKRISVESLCKNIGHVTDRHGNKTEQVFNRADAMRVLARVQADMLKSAQSYNLYIALRVIDDKEYLQLFDRSSQFLIPKENETPTSESNAA
jgi:hypothetical protein